MPAENTNPTNTSTTFSARSRIMVALLQNHGQSPSCSLLPNASYESSAQCDSDRSLIAAQPHRCGEKCRGECEADPQTWRTKKMQLGNQCCHEILRGAVRRHRISRPHKALLQQREEI